MKATLNVELLKKEMAARGLNGQELARLAHISTATMSACMQGREISMGTIRKIVAALVRTRPIALSAELTGAQTAAALLARSAFPEQRAELAEEDARQEREWAATVANPPPQHTSWEGVKSARQQPRLLAERNKARRRAEEVVVLLRELTEAEDELGSEGGDDRWAKARDAVDTFLQDWKDHGPRWSATD